METKDNRSQALRRAIELLDATKRFLEKQDFYTLATTVFYDEADCDGLCLLEDIKYWLDEYDALECVEKIPPADVRPVKHGKWIVITDSEGKTYGVCSCCGYEQYAGHLKYCPECGWKMDGREKERWNLFYPGSNKEWDVVQAF